MDNNSGINNSQSNDFLSFTESPASHGRRDWNNRFSKGQQHSGGFSNGLRQSFSPYNRGQNKNRRFQQFSSGSADISCYFHPSMLQDPWLELVRMQQQKKSTLINQNSPRGDHDKT